MFGLKLNKSFQIKTEQTNSIPYTDSELLALSLGYIETSDDRAYNKRYFIKNNKKWIHNIEALRKKLTQEYGRYICDEELEASDPEGFGYDVSAYYLHNSKEISLKDKEEFRALLDQFTKYMN